MDSDLTRLCAIPGTHDLSLTEVADVLQVSQSFVQRSIRRGRLEVKHYHGRGEKAHRVRIPRASVVRYLVNISSGDKSVILAAIAVQCPQWLHAAQVPTPTAAEMPANVIPFRKTRRRGDTETGRQEHPDQLQLFPVSA